MMHKSRMTYPEIAAIYGVDRSTIGLYIRGKR
jgi:hypothetical protein